MSEVRLFGESINQDVINEITLREKVIVGTDTGSVLSSNKRDIKDIQQFSGRTAWIRMISSVNVVNDSGNFTNTQAKNFILSGGELQVRDQDNTVKRKSGVSFQTQDRNSVYRKSDNLGVRPEAGITSFDIKHKGTYGSLREANISFNVWTREDLDRAQNIYLRPGVHMIVEWGHTVYKNKENSKNESPTLPPPDRFFNKGSSRDDIQKIIQDFRQKNNLNYDGFIGLVSNFSWSFRPDGGYDCTVRIVSAGSLLESLSTENAKRDICPRQEDDSDDSDKEQEENRSIFHLLASFGDTVKGVAAARRQQERQTDRSGSQFAGVGASIEGIQLTKEAKKLKKKIKEVLKRSTAPDLSDNSFIKKIDDILGILVEPQKQDEDNTLLFYIPLDQALTLFDAHITTEVEINIVPRIKIDPGQPFKTFPQHFSIDPTVCALPFNAKVDEEDKAGDINKIPSGLIDNLEEPGVSQILGNQNMLPLFTSRTISDNREGIGSILVNVGHIANKINGTLERSTSDLTENNAIDFIKSLLEDINTSLGSIPELDLHYNELEDRYTVVDRSKPAIKSNSDVKQINITGLSNTVKDVSIETKITPNLANMIAISAQGTEAVTGDNVTSNIGMVQWNSNIRDRFTGTIISTSNPCGPLTDEEEKVVNEYRASIKTLTNTINKINTGKESAIDELTANQGNLIGILSVPEEFQNNGRINLRAKRKSLSPFSDFSVERTLESLTDVKSRLEIAKDRISASDSNRVTVIRPFNEAYTTLFLRGEARSTWLGLRSGFKPTEYKEDLFNNHRRYVVKYFREKYFRFIGGNTSEDIQDASDPGLIPVQLSITMDGIAGFVIGQVFKIKNVERVLPENYKNYGFILTAIDHSINAGRWETTVKALTFKLPK